MEINHNLSAVYLVCTANIYLWIYSGLWELCHFLGVSFLRGSSFTLNRIIKYSCKYHNLKYRHLLKNTSRYINHTRLTQACILLSPSDLIKVYSSLSFLIYLVIKINYCFILSCHLSTKLYLPHN